MTPRTSTYAGRAPSPAPRAAPLRGGERPCPRFAGSIFGRWPRCGTAHPKVARGTGSISSVCGRRKHLNPMPAPTVACSPTPWATAQPRIWLECLQVLCTPRGLRGRPRPRMCALQRHFPGEPLRADADLLALLRRLQAVGARAGSGQAEREALRAPSRHGRRNAQQQIGAGSMGGNRIGNSNRPWRRHDPSPRAKSSARVGLPPRRRLCYQRRRGPHVRRQRCGCASSYRQECPILNMRRPRAPRVGDGSRRHRQANLVYGTIVEGPHGSGRVHRVLGKSGGR